MTVSGLPMPAPIHADAMGVTMREGNTPIVPLPAVSEAVGVGSVWGKLEMVSPTGSFKDRGVAMMLSVAIERGVSEIVEDSSGNAGASVAAYAARAGIRAHVFAPDTAPRAKMGQIRVYGASAHAVPGAREQSARAAEAYRRARGLVYASHNLSPYFIEGTKTFAYEIHTQMPRPADHTVIPVGNGSLLIGAWKGYCELVAGGAAQSVPRLHAIQSEAARPIVAEFEGVEWQADGSTTIAGGISVGAPPRKAQVARAVRQSGGRALAVSDERILWWQNLLAASEGIFAEPTSAAAFAGLELLAKRGHVRASDTVLVPVTGSGLKDAQF